MTPAHVLAMMLTVGPAPGRTLYSDTEVRGDAPPVIFDDGAYRELEPGELEPNQCTQPGNPACRRPRYDAELGRWLRTETWGEGLPRYWTIAGAIAGAAGDDAELARYLVTITRHESGWWQSVHAGWNHRPYRASTELEDHGRSWGLGQIMCGRSGLAQITVAGFEHHDCRDLVGTGAETTGRAIAVSAARVRGHMAMCRRRGAGPACVLTSYAGTAISEAHPLIRARLRTYARTAEVRPLDAATCAALGIGGEVGS